MGLSTDPQLSNKWAAIRALYKEQTPEILSRPRDVFWIDPYEIDWPSIFTPIEDKAWQTIRGLGIPLYPQYPVGGVFVDFGDPVKKIALECDGKAYHDATSDSIRDMKLEQLGWIVYRVTGAECNRPDIDLEPLLVELHNEGITQQEFDCMVWEWANRSSDGLISAIAWKHYGKARSAYLEPHFTETLARHSGTFLG